MSFKFENPTEENITPEDNNLENELPQKEETEESKGDAILKTEGELSPEMKNIETEVSPEVIEEIRTEAKALEKGGTLSKIKEKLSPAVSKALIVTLLGSSLVLGAGISDKAEARGRHRGRGYSAGEIIGSIAIMTGVVIVNDILRKKEMERRDAEMARREAERAQRDARRQMEMEQRRAENEIHRIRRQFAAQQQRALSEYQREVGRAKNKEQMKIAEEKYGAKTKAINEAERKAL